MTSTAERLRQLRITELLEHAQRSDEERSLVALELLRRAEAKQLRRKSNEARRRTDWSRTG
jgi:hypothetical protein